MRHKQVNNQQAYIPSISAVAGVPKVTLDCLLDSVFKGEWVIQKVISGYRWGCYKSKFSHYGYRCTGIVSSSGAAYSELVNIAKEMQLLMNAQDKLSLELKLLTAESMLEVYLSKLIEPMQKLDKWN